MRDILISTAGTSLPGKLRHHENNRLKELAGANNASALCRALLKMDQTQRLCRAERVFPNGMPPLPGLMKVLTEN